MAFSTLWMTVAAILATLEIAKSEETVLPEDGRYFSPNKAVLSVSLDNFLLYRSDAQDYIDIRSLSNAASSAAHRCASI
jgi:hypothetical protein